MDLCLLLLVLLPLASSTTTHPPPHRLCVDVTSFNQVLHDVTSTYYVINLQRGVKYEVRISYAAVTPTDFVIEVHPSNLNTGRATTMGRKLLNVEQLHFTCISDGEYTIKVTAHRVGFPLVEERLMDPVKFNIIVNQLYYGASKSTWKLCGFIVVVVAVIVGLGAPWLHNYMKWMMTMEEEGGAGKDLHVE